MTKKLSILLRLTMSAVIAMMLMFSTAIPAFADGDPVYGTETDPAQAAITKKLQMPIGTTTPAVTFTFEIAKVDLDGASGSADLALMPTITNKTLSFTSADIGNTVGGTKTVYKETTDLFVGITWPKAGVYKYHVTELTTGFTPTNNRMVYSAAEYDLVVYVDNKTDGSGVYIRAIAAIITVINEPDDKVGDKVDPTPGPKRVVGDYSEMMWTNMYERNNGDDTVLAVSKAVSGLGSDQTKYFTFNITCSKPELFPDPVGSPTIYKAYVYNSAGYTDMVADLSAGLNTAAANVATDGDGNDYIMFPAGTTVTVNLKHGQWLSFIGMPVGAIYNVTEAAAVDYTPSYVLTRDATPGTAVVGTENSALSISPPTRYITEGFDAGAPDKAAYTNAYKTVTPTGISVDNLPYYVIVVLALGALVGFVVFKSRRRERPSEQL